MIWLTPITAVLLSWVLIDVLRLPERYALLNRKPFNCALCLSFWLALLICFLPDKVQQIAFITLVTASIAAYVETKN